MKGSIRFFAGLIVCMAAAGADDAATLTQIAIVSAIGLALMASGANAIRKQAQ